MIIAILSAFAGDWFMRIKFLKTVFIKSLPVMAGYLILGMGFGILLKANGYGVIWALAMSVFVYAGSMQFVGVSLIAAGASLFSVALTTLMVNARHLFYGLSMIERYQGAGRKKLYLMHALTDETYSLACVDGVPQGVNPHWYYFFLSLFDQLYWVAGSAVGSLLGAVLPFDTAGIDFSMTALFVTVYIEHWLTGREHRRALIGIGSSVLCLLVFGRDGFIIPSMVVITALLLTIRKPLERAAKNDDR